jgi:hypothetical protein
MTKHISLICFFLLLFVPGISLPQSVAADTDTTRSGIVNLAENPYYDRTLHPRFHHVKVSLGPSFVLGDFGSIDPFSTASGFATNAFSGGIEYNIEAFRGIGFTVSESFSFHNTKSEGWLNKYPGYNFEIHNWLLLWSTAGMFLDYDLSQSVNAYVDGQGGYLYTNYPQMSIIDTYNQSGIITAPSLFTFGYKVGGGIRWNRYELGVHYLSADPDFDAYTDFRSLSLNPQANIRQFPQKVPVRLLMFTFGYILG